MSYLYQPVYEYEKEVFGDKIKINFASSIVYNTRERARLCALDAWNMLCSEDDTLLNIEIRQLTIG